MTDIEILIAADSDVPIHVSDSTHAFATGSNLSIGYFLAASANLAFVARFRAVPIPRGARIRSAIVRLEAAATLAEVVVNARIDGLASGNSETPTHAEFDGGALGATSHGRSTNNRTSAQVAWSGIAAITNGVDFDTPDITAIIQEITSRSDWVEGNALTLFLGDEDQESDQENNHYRTALRSSVGPRLLITFTVSADLAIYEVSLGELPQIAMRVAAKKLQEATQAQVE